MRKILMLTILLMLPWLVNAPAFAQAPAQDKAPALNQQDIQRKIDELQKQVDALKEQGRTREKLSITAEEKAEQEKAVLTAVGREYTLMQKGTFELEYSLRYEYAASTELTRLIGNTVIFDPQTKSNHTIRNAIGVQYGLLNNLTVNVNVPFVYVYDKTGTTAARDATDLGDVTVGLDYQPFKASDWPTTTLTMSAILPTGRSPFKIDRETDLPTGSGFYGVSLGMNMSKSLDPAMAFGALSATYRFKPHGVEQKQLDGRILDQIEPGMSFNAALGMAYAISYAVSMNVQFQYGYYMNTKYYFLNSATPSESAAYSTASLILGTGWRITPKTTLALSLGIGLTSNDPDFLFMLRLPFMF